MKHPTEYPPAEILKIADALLHKDVPAETLKAASALLYMQVAIITKVRAAVE